MPLCKSQIKTNLCKYLLNKYRQLSKLNFEALYSRDVIFRHPNGDLVTSEEYKNEFKNALASIGIIEKHPYWRPHSLRKGEISDLVAEGVYIKNMLRHTPESETTFEIIQIETDEEAFLVGNKNLNHF